MAEYRLIKDSRWNLRDLYRFPVTVVLYLLVRRNYRLRSAGLLPDQWYAHDLRLISWGYFVVFRYG